ncbi:TonB-dependent receptor domain-containing protein [Sphingobium fluviale]|uniref:TonB-dependent receptor domain-containing protein n=1 Tax=Sphingobium fluviale TaxID=2506423 RepID=UPI001FE60895|nr:TonB-dependent receptor [Sphingobium fluviale]
MPPRSCPDTACVADNLVDCGSWGGPAGYSGFRLPTLNELYGQFVIGSITTNANAGLMPEKLRGIEAGIDVDLAGKTTLSATLFYNMLENAITNVTLNAAMRQRQNVDAIIAKGLEVTADSKFSDFILSASYADADSKVSAHGPAVSTRIC